MPAAPYCAPLQGLVLDLATTNAVNQVFPYPIMYGRTAEAAADSSAAPSGGAPNFTGTNNQESGVDEGDIVKTDGRYIYTIRDREVVIVKSWPTRSMRVVGRYKLPKHVTPRQLQLRGTRLVVLSSIWEPSVEIAKNDQPTGFAAERSMPFYHPPKFSGTRVTVLNIRSRVRPRLISEIDVEGWLSQSRLIGNDLYFVSNASLRVPDYVASAALARAKKLVSSDLDSLTNRYDWKAMEAARKKATAVVRAYLAKRFRVVNMSAAMPRTRSRLARRPMSTLYPMYSCNALTLPNAKPSNSIINVSHINIARPSTSRSAGVSGNGWKVYASDKAIYVAAPKYTGTVRTRATTQIIKFALNGGARFAAIGSVPGTLLNQFAMSEHNGFLRVMTTDRQWGRDGRNNRSANNLFVLSSWRQRMRIVGKVTGLAEGERIFAARMFGDKGYMVTFRQTDPLFTFDLSNPYKPKLAGELKVNGFSSYIHPLDGDRLLTIGRDADDDGRIKGLHLQIFDVSNPSRPTRTHQELIEGGRYAHSAAQYDHHAFTFDAKSGTLALPISGTIDANSGYRQDNYFSGLDVFQVSRRGFAYKGFVTHANQASGKNRWAGQIQRSMIIGKTLVSVSRIAVMASSLSNPNRELAIASLIASAVTPRQTPASASQNGPGFNV